MARILDSYNEIGFLRPAYNKVRRIGISPRYWRYRLSWWLVNKIHYTTQFPIHIDIESTNHCNLRCSMCPHGLDEYKMEKGYFDINLYKDVLAECRKHGLSSLKLNIRGEPLMHKQLVDMVALAKEAGILEVMFNTNGLLLTPEKTRALVEAGLDYLIVSIDGATAETYNRIRVGGDYNVLRDNLEYFIGYRHQKWLRKPLLRLQYVAMEDNEHEIPLYMDAWKSRVDVITVNRYSNRGCGDRKVFDMVPVGRANCHHPWRRMSVTWDGNAQMCCGDWDGRCTLGNVRDISIHNMWHGDRYRDYRKKLLACRLDDIPCCKSCFVLASYKWEKDR